MIKETFNPDRGLQSWMSWMIRMTEKKASMKQKRWQPGEPMELLFVGYAGSRNTGADVRVSEMLRQFRHVLGEDQSKLSIVTIDPASTQGYFPNVHQLHIPKVFPPFLYQHCPQFDGVVACEGSMFKSKFADALSTLMAGALGMANAEGKISIGYGAEAGKMTESLASFVQNQCKESLIVCRNQASEDILSNMNIRTAPGTDTAWTFPIPESAIGENILKKHGWDGATPVVAFCPIDPFCWPVRPNLTKTLKRYLLNMHTEEHYQSIYFHDIDAANKKKFQTYVQALSNALDSLRKSRNIFPILIGMEKLDRKACEAINQTLTDPVPMFISDTYDMNQMVAILHQASALVSSRFHAIVCSMLGLVPSAGITMDERILNLLEARGDRDLLMYVDQEDLEVSVIETTHRLLDEHESIAHKIGVMIPKEIQKMGEMGRTIAQEITRVYPEFQPQVVSESWEDYLPELSAQTQERMETYG